MMNHRSSCCHAEIDLTDGCKVDECDFLVHYYKPFGKELWYVCKNCSNKCELECSFVEEEDI